MPKQFLFFFLIPADSAIYLPFLWRAEINRYTMSQHLIREVQQLKHQVAKLQEGYEHRDMGVEIDDLKIRLEAIEKHLDMPDLHKRHPRGFEPWKDQS